MRLGMPFAEGNTATLYLDGARMIKLFRASASPEEASREAAKQQLARAAGFPVPEVYDVTTIQGRQAIVMAYVAGKTLAELIEADQAALPAWLARSVAMQLRIHGMEAPGLESMAGKLQRQIMAAGQLNHAQKEALLTRLHSIELPAQLCHGDYHIKNVILSEDQLCVIDWVDASAGDPLADVCRSYVIYMGVSEALAKAYLAEYCAQKGLAEEAVLAWLPVIAGARLSEGMPEAHARELVRIVEKYAIL